MPIKMPIKMPNILKDEPRRALRRWILGAAAAAVFAMPAAAEQVWYTFDKNDITCEVDLWAVHDTLARRGISEFALRLHPSGQYVLTATHGIGAATPEELVTEFVRGGFSPARIADPAAAVLNPI